MCAPCWRPEPRRPRRRTGRRRLRSVDRLQGSGTDMRKHRMLVAAALVAVTVLGACGSDGGDSKAKFADQLQDECRTIARGLRDIDTPTGDNLDDFESAANDASKVYGTGLTALKKLKAPS